MRVHAHVVVWLGEQLLVHTRTQRGRQYLTLPGGRVNEREGVLDALSREVREEVGIDVEIGELRMAAEANGATRQELILIFNGQLGQVLDPTKINLVDVDSFAAEQLMPPILAHLDEGTVPSGCRWLGNLYDASRNAP